MNPLWILASVLCGSASERAPLSIQEIRTASDTVLVAYVKSPNASGPVWDRVIQTDEVKTDDPSLWKLNGQPVAAIHKFVTPADACDHHIYLQTPKLVAGKTYTLETPYGSKSFVFDDRQILCESIKVNQNAYSGLSKARYANFAIWLGTGGSQNIGGPLPAYTVFKQGTGEQVAQGTLQPVGEDVSSGDFVCRIDLSAVPEGGPYRISVKGYGCSYPFGVGGDFSRRLGHIAFRSLYYQRCGCPIVEPFARANIRTKPCHTVVYDTSARPAEAGIKVSGSEPPLTVHGGYHDAGDADRRPYHLMVPVVLLTTFEAFPALFTDDQFNIPDKFDAGFNIAGKGNGIPDIVDEAAWGTLIWETLQKADGAVRGGTETEGYPSWGISFDQDAKRYGTLMPDDRATALAAGLFMNLARVLKPFKPQRCAELQKRGDLAFAAAGNRIRPAHKLYYAVQKYLLTGDEAAHAMVKSLAPATASFQDSYCNEAGGFLSDGNYWLASFFMSYLLEKIRSTDPGVVRQLMASLKAAADREIEHLNGSAYPVGWPGTLDLKKHNWNQGAFTSQGQLAYPCLMQWALTKEQKYLDAASQLMDYNQGLNPIGKCYMSGVGFDRVHHPHDRESTFAQEKGWGPRPGIFVYGPAFTCKAVQVPPAQGLARERRYVDHLGSFEMDEFTVYQSLVFPAAIYPVLARGGTWNPAKDPFASQQK